MAQTHLKIVRVVSGCNFNAARSELHINIIIGYNGYFASDKRKEGFADQVFISFVIWVYRNGCVAEKSLRTGCCDFYIIVTVFNRIFYMPEEAVLLGVFNFCV